MSTEKPEITTVTSKGQVTIPSRLREQYELERGAKLMVVPTDHGLMLKKLELPSIKEFNQRVKDRESEAEAALTMEEIEDLVHDRRGVDE